MLEKFVSLIGIMLFIPAKSIDINNQVLETTQSKVIQVSIILLLRVILQICVLLLFVFLFCCVSLLMGSVFPVGFFALGAVANAIFLGSAGLLACLITCSAVIGYFVPCLLYLINLLMGNIAVVLNLFSLAYLGYTDKIIILAVGMIFLVASFIISSRNYVL